MPHLGAATCSARSRACPGRGRTSAYSTTTPARSGLRVRRTRDRRDLRREVHRPTEAGRRLSYPALVKDLSGLLVAARRASARVVNTLMTTTYWEMGRRIVEHEQSGAKRAAYGKELMQRLSRDLTQSFGRGFGVDNLELFRAFYLTYPPAQIGQTVSGKSESPIRKLEEGVRTGPKSEALIRESRLAGVAGRFPLPWTHYVHLLRRSPLLPPPAPLPGGDRPQGRQVHPRRCRPDAPLPQLCPRALDAARREPSGRPDPLLGEERRRRPLRSRRPAQQGAGPRVSARTSRREAPGRGDREDPPAPGGAPHYGVRSIASTIRVNGICATSLTSLTSWGLGASKRHMQCDSPGTNTLRRYLTFFPSAVNCLPVSIARRCAAPSCSSVMPFRSRSTM